MEGKGRENSCGPSSGPGPLRAETPRELCTWPFPPESHHHHMKRGQSNQVCPGFPWKL